MTSRILVDSIVRQTMVLIAQVATNAGMRTPLAHIANQVFMDLIQALEEQGLGQKVVADMFGLALRSYQQKVERLGESASHGGTTLWEAVHGYLSEKQVVARAELMRRFARDNAASVASVLNDMTESGLVYKTGRADGVVYRIAPAADLEQALGDDPGAHQALVWLIIYRDAPVTREALLERLALSAVQLDAAIAALLADGRVQRAESDGALRSQHVLLPLGEAAGWEAGLLDHHRAMIAAMCAKLRNGQTRALPVDQVGGSTYSFDVWPGHPCEARALSLLAEQRRQLGALWDEVAAHNATVAVPADAARVTFYCGQLVASEQLQSVEDGEKER